MEASKRVKLIETYSNRFVSRIEKLNPQLYKFIVSSMSDFDLDKGTIISNANNLGRIESIGNQVENYIFSSSYRSDLKDYISGFKDIATVNNAHFKNIFKSFTKKSYYDDVIKSSQKSALELLAQDGIRKEFVQPLKEVLTNSITGNTTFKQAVSNLSTFVLGNDTLDGTMQRYVKSVVRDAYAVSDRRYAAIVSNDLGVHFYFYSGGTVRDSRNFCLERVGKYFHISEIQAWGGLDWQGKAKGTDQGTIFSLLGGYNCMHVLVPISIDAVPPEDIARNLANGNITQEQINTAA